MEKRPKPAWLKTRIPSGETYLRLKRRIAEKELHTVCQSARCPNVAECWQRNYATFMILGEVCSRNCAFCSVPSGAPQPVDDEEGRKILEMAGLMELKFIVITSVTRDDLPDKGSSHFAAVVRTLKAGRPEMKVEVLVPDFAGRKELIDTVVAARPDLFAHNLETVASLYAKVNRPTANYRVSLDVLAHAAARGMRTKSGIMVGLGESRAELRELFHDLRAVGVSILTIGQYLQPTRENAAVEKFYTPEEFAGLQDEALACGFIAVESGHFVRSSYYSERSFNVVMHEIPCVQ